MSLIPCPECDESVSDRAHACPHCGFPVAEEIGKVLTEVTGSDRVRSARQQAAGAKLQRWATRYVEDEQEGKGGSRWAARGESFIEQHKRLVLVMLVTIIVVLQLVLIYSAIYS